MNKERFASVWDGLDERVNVAAAAVLRIEMNECLELLIHHPYMRYT